MGFFSDLGKKTTETTGKIAREAKLKLKISENKGKINDIYEIIGKKVYEKHVRENSVCIKGEIEEECSKIDELAREIEDARLEILKLNKKRLCSKCSAEIEEGALFCPKCGEKQSEEPTVKEEAVQKLENTEVQPEKQEEKEAVIEDVKEETAQSENNQENKE